MVSGNHNSRPTPPNPPPLSSTSYFTSVRPFIHLLAQYVCSTLTVRTTTRCNGSQSEYCWAPHPLRPRELRGALTSNDRLT